MEKIKIKIVLFMFKNYYFVLLKVIYIILVSLFSLVACSALSESDRSSLAGPSRRAPLRQPRLPWTRCLLCLHYKMQNHRWMKGVLTSGTSRLVLAK